MGKISTYGFDSSVTLSDFVIGTDADDSNITKSYLIGDILSLAPDVTWGSITGTLSDQADLQSALNAKQDTLVSGTNIKTVNSTTLLGSGNLNVQEVLVSGTNIKTVDGNSLLGSGNIDIVHPGYVFQLIGTDYNQQLPSGLDSALQVKFGGAQTLTNVELDANGQITFLTGGNYIINAFGSLEREGSGGVATIAWRALINGVQAGIAKAFEMDKTGIIMPYEITIPLTVSASDRLTFEIMRDSSGVDDGGLYVHPLNGGWGETPSSEIQIWKNE